MISLCLSCCQATVARGQVQPEMQSPLLAR